MSPLKPQRLKVSQTSEKSGKSRRSPEELVRAIMDALPVRAVASVSLLAEELGSTWETVNRYLDLAIWLQEQPKVEIVWSKNKRRRQFRLAHPRRAKKKESDLPGGR